MAGTITMRAGKRKTKKGPKQVSTLTIHLVDGSIQSNPTLRILLSQALESQVASHNLQAIMFVDSSSLIDLVIFPMKSSLKP